VSVSTQQGEPARMIHERFCCNRRFAATTSLDAVAWRPSRRARRSVGQRTVSSMPPSLAGSALEPASPTLTKGGQPPCRIPTKGAHPLRNSQAGCCPAARATSSSMLDCKTRPRIHDPNRVDTLVLFSIRKALAAVDQGRTSVECPDFSTNQSHTASHLNSSKPINIDQAAFGLNRHNVALS
jgi:hypothetical protein